jgi:hypothetical protein
MEAKSLWRIRLRNSALTFALLIAVIAGSFFSPVCRANDKQGLPDAPVPVVTERKCRETQAVPPCTGEPQQASAQAQAGAGSAAIRRTDSSDHRFWDRENVVLFSFVAASRALDYSSTLNMRRRGRQEVFLTNGIVDNHPAFAAIEAGGTAVSIGASYLFHRYQRHRLEHWASIIHASLATSGAVRNYCLKTVHLSTAP